ncbi:hypothetical protein [Cetobacterium somerae]
MANQQIDNIEDINEAINPITPPINGQEGLEILGHNRNQSVILSRFSRSFFKIYSHLIALYSSIKNLNNNKVSKSGDTMSGDLRISKQSPIIFFDDFRSENNLGGYVGYGSREGIFQIVNRVTGKTLMLNHDGILAYNGAARFDTVYFGDLTDVSIRKGNAGEIILEAEKPFVYVGGEYRRLYHQGFIPSATEVGAEPTITNKRSGWNLDKTDLTENDSNKLFTPKGALNLFNTLTTNFTDAINTAKEALRTDIIKKVSKTGDTMTGDLRINKGAPLIFFDDARESDGRGGFIGFGSGNGKLIVANYITGKNLMLDSDSRLKYNGEVEFDRVYLGASSDVSIRKGNAGEIILEAEKPFVRTGGQYRRLYHQGFVPSPTEVGAVNKIGDTMTGTLNIQNGSPLLYLKDTRTANGNNWVGCGSSQIGILSFYNDYAKKAMDITHEGKFRFNGSEVFSGDSIQMGTVGAVRWIKYPNGVAECYGFTSGKNVTFPFTFRGVEYVNVVHRGTGETVTASVHDSVTNNGFSIISTTGTSFYWHAKGWV